MPDAAPPPQMARTELAALAEIGRAILEAQLDQDQLCELIYQLAGQIVPTDNFQLGLFDDENYDIRVWVKDGVRQPPASFALPDGQGIVNWVRTSRSSLLVHDFAAEMDSLPAQPAYHSDRPPRSAIFLPLPLADTVIGCISIQSFEPNAFSEDDLRLLTVLANQSASALNNARLYKRGQKRLNDLLAVAEVGRKATSILDLDELLTESVALIQSRLGFYHVQIFVVPLGSDRAYFKASSSGHGLNEKWQREARSLRIGQEGIIGAVAQHGEPLLANDVTREPRYIPDDPRLLPDTRAELAVPMLFEQQVLGVLDVQSTQPGAFGPDDVSVLSTLADQLAVAIHSARAYEAQREEAWVTTVMLQVAEATSQADGVADVLDAAVRVIAMLAGVDSATIWLWNLEMGCFDHGASFGLRLPEDEEINLSAALRFLSGDWPMLDRLRVEKAPAVIDMAADGLPKALASICPGDTMVLLPMLNKSQVFGVLGVSLTREHSPHLSERRLAMLGGIAHQVASAVDNARLSAAQEEEAWVSTMLLQVAEATGRFQPIDVTLEQIARLAPLLAGVDRCAVLLRDHEGGYAVRKVHAQREELAAVYENALIAVGELPLLDDACRLGQPLVVDDAAHNERVPDAWRERFGSRTLLIVPLLVADEVIGALLADDVEAAHRFSPRRVRILAGIASQTALALENSRLQAQEAQNVRLSHELELAHSIQRSLLPQGAPHVPGYEVVYRWRSAREVGGDFFDFIPLSAGKLGLVIADVSDKGVPAALYMMFARTLLRAAALSGRPPGAVLERTNELIVSDSASDMFVTAYYSILDPRHHLLTYASGGHNLALRLAASDAACEPITTAGLALGIIAPINIEQKTVLLDPGDIVLFYTDGVSEALNPAGEEFGEARLAEVLTQHRAEPAESIAEAIETALADFVGPGSQYDDITLVVLKREG